MDWTWILEEARWSPRSGGDGESYGCDRGGFEHTPGSPSGFLSLLAELTANAAGSTTPALASSRHPPRIIGPILRAPGAKKTARNGGARSGDDGADANEVRLSSSNAFRCGALRLRHLPPSQRGPSASNSRRLRGGFRRGRPRHEVRCASCHSFRCGSVWWKYEEAAEQWQWRWGDGCRMT